MYLELEVLERYLSNRYDTAVHIEELRPLGGEETGPAALKQFGYGRPLLATYQVDGRRKQEVLHRIRRTPYGRERADDRAAAVWLDYQTFNRLPRHVTAEDMLVHTEDGQLHSIRTADELLLVTTYRPGRLYADSLARIRDVGVAQPVDTACVEKLAAYLAQIHQTRHEEPALWRRRLRDLIGHGEGIMGLTDSYPPGLDYAPQSRLRHIEEAANRWRWQLKPKLHRLSQVHGDFHPFNILFDEDNAFYLLDRSRGEWGEPADDVSCLSINYIFFSLQRKGRLERPFTQLHDRFWQEYLALSDDREITAVIQPWFAWRALVLASPIWYPTITDEVRYKLFNFAEQVMSVAQFDYRQVNHYLEGN
jgi:thiamine kinase-like enzyme